MIEEISTRKEDTTTKTLVKNPAKTRYVQLLFLPLDRGNESQLDQPLLDPLTYDRRISKSLIPSDETENHHLVLTVPGTLFRQTERREREEITKNHSARSELPDRSAQLGKPLKPDHSKQHSQRDRPSALSITRDELTTVFGIPSPGPNPDTGVDQNRVIFLY